MDQVRAKLLDSYAVIAGGHSAGTVSVLLAVRPLKKSVDQKVTSKNAKRDKYGKRHDRLTLTAVQALPAAERLGAAALKSPEMFIRISLRRLYGGAVRRERLRGAWARGLFEFSGGGELPRAGMKFSTKSDISL